MGTFIIAEAGVNHNGDDALALELVACAARSGADAVKFQTFTADKLVRPGADKAEYQIRETGGGDQRAMLEALELSEAMHRKLFARCGELGIEFMSTPFDADAADFLIGLGIKRIKVPSGEITNEPFLEHLAAQGLPMIVSTGMASLEEIQRAVEVIAATRARCNFTEPLAQILTLLHCTSNYPAEVADVNLRAMITIAQQTGLPVGYSDHTLGLAVSTAAVALGAQVIEKHFTLDRNLPGPDHRASLLPDELRHLVSQIRDAERALGSPIKAPVPAELPVRALVRRSITTAKALQRGDVLTAGDIAMLRPGDGIAPRERGNVIGRKAARDLAAGTTLQWTDLQS